MSEMDQIGFLGAGKMATALAKGFIQSGVASPDKMIACDLFEPARAAFSEVTGARTTSNNSEVMTESNVVILAVKPNQIESLAAELQGSLNKDLLLISIAAGVTLNRLEELFGSLTRIIRVMPNTPALVAAGASAYAANHSCREGDGDLAKKLLSAVGLAFEVQEQLLDAVTGLSGSGPAYVYLMIEALSDGGVRSGLPRDIATQLAAQTVLGSAKMVLETKEHPGKLKDMVTSPGGTTIAGIHQLEQGCFRGTLMDAVLAATEKAKELGAS
jgi:pyrroline-5-carboxylate reductase